MSDETPEVTLNEKYQVMPEMSEEKFEQLKEDIAQNGLLTPIDVDEDGNILDGHHRYRACVELGVTDFPTIVRPGLSEEERRVFARKTNMMRRHLTREQKRGLIASQLKETPEWSNNRIGGELGVSGKTVKRVREELEATSEIPKLDTLVGADGKERPATKKRKPAVMVDSADKLRALLARFEAGEVSPEKLEGFLEESSVTIEYDPMAGFTDAERRLWHLYASWLVENGWDPEAIAYSQGRIWRQGFQTPEEWLTTDWAWGPDVSDEAVDAWRDYREAHADVPDDELAEMAEQLSSVE